MSEDYKDTTEYRAELAIHAIEMEADSILSMPVGEVDAVVDRNIVKAIYILAKKAGWRVKEKKECR